MRRSGWDKRLIVAALTAVMLTGMAGVSDIPAKEETERFKDEEGTQYEGASDTEAAPDTEDSETGEIKEEAPERGSALDFDTLQQLYVYTPVSGRENCVSLGLTDDFKAAVNSADGKYEVKEKGTTVYTWNAGDPLPDPGAEVTNLLGDTLRVVSFKGMFKNLDKAEELDLSEWHTEYAENLEDLFNGCVNLEKLDISGFDTSSATSLANMFRGCSKLKNVDLSHFDTSKAANLDYMFAGCTLIGSEKMLDLSGFDTKQVKAMHGLFKDCVNAKNIDISGFTFARIAPPGNSTVGTSNMFEGLGEKLPEGAKTVIFIKDEDTVSLLKDGYYSVVYKTGFERFDMRVFDTANLPDETLSSFYDITWQDSERYYKVALTSDFKAAMQTEGGSFTSMDGVYTWRQGEPLPNPVPFDGSKYSGIRNGFPGMFRDMSIESADLSLFNKNDEKVNRVYNCESMFENCRVKTINLKSFVTFKNIKGSLANMFKGTQSSSGEKTVILVNNSSHKDFLESADNADMLGIDPDKAEIKTMVRLSFDTGSHGGAADALETEYGQRVEKPADPECVGWRFDGWYKNKNFDAGAKAFTDGSETATADTTFYAKWEYDLKPDQAALEKFYQYARIGAGEEFRLALTDEFKECLKDPYGSFSVELANGDIYVWNAGDPLPDPGESHTDAHGTLPVTTLDNLFNRLSAAELDLSKWHTGNVKSMRYFLAYCTSLKKLDVTGLDTSSVTDMTGAFMYLDANGIRLYGIEDLDTSSLTDMTKAFAYMDSVEKLDLSKWNTARVTSFKSAFWGCRSLKRLDLSGFIFAEGADLQHMLGTVGNSSDTPTEVCLKDMESKKLIGNSFSDYGEGITWNVVLIAPSDPSNLTPDELSVFYRYDKNYQISYYQVSLTDAFADQLSMASGGQLETPGGGYVWHTGDPLPNPNPDNSGEYAGLVRSFRGMFKDCAARELDLSLFDSSDVVDFREMFQGCTELKALNLCSLRLYDDSLVEDMLSDTCKSASSQVRGYIDDENSAQILETSEKTGIDKTKLTFDRRCRVTFDMMGYGGYINPQMLLPGEKAEKPADPVSDYAFFDGWYSDSEFSAPFDFDKELTESAVVYAKWRKYKWVRFDMGGHGERIADRKVAEGDATAAPETPVQDGYAFEGWFTSKDFDEAYDFSKPVGSSFTLYAKWSESEPESSGSSSSSSSSSKSGGGDTSSSSSSKSDGGDTSSSSSSKSGGGDTSSSSSSSKSAATSSSAEDGKGSSSSSGKDEDDKGKGSSSRKGSDSSSSSSAEGEMAVITAARGNVMLVGDRAVISLPGVDPAKIIAKGKAGTYSDGVVTAVRKGSVKLLAPVSRNGKEKKAAVCVIKVEQPKLKPALKLKPGKTKKLKLSGTKSVPDKWESSDVKVAEVSNDGTITAKAAGSARITARLGKHSFTCELTVK